MIKGKKTSRAYRTFIGIVASLGIMGLGILAIRDGSEGLLALGFFVIGVGFILFALSLTFLFAGFLEYYEGWTYTPPTQQDDGVDEYLVETPAGKTARAFPFSESYVPLGFMLMCTFGMFTALSMFLIIICGLPVSPLVPAFFGGAFGTTLFIVPFWIKRKRIKKAVCYDGELLLVRGHVRDLLIEVESLRGILLRLHKGKPVSMIVKYGGMPWQRTEVVLKNPRKLIEVIVTDHPDINSRVTEQDA